MYLSFSKVGVMKKVQFIFLGLCFLTLLFSCKTKSDEEKTAYDDFQFLSLTEYGLQDVEIALPDKTTNIGASVIPVIEQLASHKWKINVGRRFELHILDQGELENLVQEEKKRLKEEFFYKITYIEENDSLLMYQKELVPRGISSAPKSVGKKYRSFHIFGIKKIGGFHYVLQSKSDGVLDRPILELMKKSIQSFKKIN